MLSIMYEKDKEYLGQMIGVENCYPTYTQPLYSILPLFHKIHKIFREDKCDIMLLKSPQVDAAKDKHHYPILLPLFFVPERICNDRLIILILMSSKKRIGKYIIFLSDLLGQGAFSKVYNGIIEDTLEQVAIKVVVKSIIEKDEYTRNAFYSEIKIMKKLKSPNIIKFLDVHQTKNNFYIVLEKAEGTLRAHLRKWGPLSQKNAMSCLIQILNGFGELVKNGVIHRDLKPQNILVRNEQLKIADFGFAKHLENNSILKTIVGTPAYMAPQILKEERYTYKCDIWSIGVIAYELLVGKVPWQFTSQIDLEGFRQQILTRKVMIPEHLNISEQMKDFIFGCICIDESKRFDWEKIFTHPIFGQRYSQNFSKEGSTKITFILSNFRMNLHSKNLNLNKILTKLGPKLNKNDFYNLIKLIYRDISEEDIAIFFNFIAQKDGFVYISEFVEFLKKYQCRMTGINLSDKEMDTEVELETVTETEKSENFQSENYKILDRLKNSIEKGGLVITSIFQQIKEKKFSLQDFKVLIGKIDPSLGNKDIASLFREFDEKGQESIQVADVYLFFCKIAQEVPSM